MTPSTSTLGDEGRGPVPADLSFASLDGTPLRARLWAHPNPRALLLISHGLGEHGGSYRRTAEPLVRSLGIEVLAFDYRGSGRSSGKRGVVRSYDDLSLDLDAANRLAEHERPGRPRFLLGHSNGGLVALRTVLGRDLGLAGLILSNPPLRVTAHVPAWKLGMAEILRRLAPRVTLATGLDNRQLTHDAAVRAEIEADPLRHDRISPPLYFGMKDSGPMLMARAGEVRLPTLMILGGADPIIDPRAVLEFFEALGSVDKSLKVYPGMRHEPLSEVGREAVIADLAKWLEARLGPARSGDAGEG